MKTLPLLPIALAALAVRPLHAGEFDYRLALPNYTFQFPQDHGPHWDFRTEWWYFTGHLSTRDAHRFGYELTFFRMGLRDRKAASNPSRWTPQDLFFAHFAVTDVSESKFHYHEKRGRTGVGVAGISENPLRIWIGNWSLKLDGQKFKLQAAEGGFEIQLELEPAKPPIIHGENGVSQKSEGLGQASHYYSLTRLDTRGDLRMDGRKYPVTGLSWMDHEFGSNQMSPEQVGWDWFCVQFEDGGELMLYRMRRKDGQPDVNSSGSLILPDGSHQHLRSTDFEIEETGRWVSARSKASYPMGWVVKVKPAGLEIRLSPEVLNQELVTDQTTQVTYWEGSVRVEGQRQGRPVAGAGYVEMTGYAGGLDSRF